MVPIVHAIIVHPSAVSSAPTASVPVTEVVGAPGSERLDVELPFFSPVWTIPTTKEGQTWEGEKNYIETKMMVFHQIY